MRADRVLELTFSSSHWENSEHRPQCFLNCFDHHSFFIFTVDNIYVFGVAVSSKNAEECYAVRREREMRTWTGSWRWIMLVLLAWGTLLFYIGGHLVRDSEQLEHPSRELSKILAKLERLKHQNMELRRMAETLR